MMISARSLDRYHLEAEDGKIGDVENLYFDERVWSVPYLVVRTGNFLTGKSILIYTRTAGKVDIPDHSIPISMTKEEIRNSPYMDARMPVHRQKEMMYFQHMGWSPYWDYSPPGMATAGNVQPDPSTRSTRDMLEGQNPHLRDTFKIIGYGAAARDGSIGHIEDFIVDVDEWMMRFVVVDTGKFLGLKKGEKKIIPVRRISDIDWSTGTVTFAISSSDVDGIPLYVPSQPFDPSAGKVEEYFDQLK
ncbi:MAG: PRC-barrel domain-containing protein [Proteobacteria bacterium]|nr:PRC-barrel domain-containing protein [Pseudomonadota bacterium]